MIVVVYRWRLHPGGETAFQDGWRRATESGLSEFGSGGSALCRLEDGVWMGVARWPDREALARFRARGVDPTASDLMQGAVAESFPPLEGDCVADLWAPLSSTA